MLDKEKDDYISLKELKYFMRKVVKSLSRSLLQFQLKKNTFFNPISLVISFIEFFRSGGPQTIITESEI